ncbi:translocation/assembly module TamB [Labilibacter sediminis]|nr:translocation/assembly module TamB [Labilibacter sediminis]
MILIPGVQNFAGNILTSRLSEDTGVNVSFKDIRFYPIKKLVINDFLINDTQKDTLLFIKEISASIDSLNFKERKLYLGRITLNELNSKIYKDSLGTNFHFIIDSLFKERSESSTWKYNTQEIWLRNSKLSYKNKLASASNTKFNPNNVELSSVNILIDHIDLFSDSISARMKNLSAKDHSGLMIKNSKGEIRAGSKGFNLYNFRLSANHSYLSIDHFSAKYDSAQALKNFIHNVPFSLKINSLSADKKDFSYIIPNFPNLQDRINLKGTFSGTIANLKGSNIHINAGSNTQMQTNFDISGLPDINESYLYLNVKKLSTTIGDLEKVTGLNDRTKEIDFPESFDKMGNIEYSGKFSGFTDNLVAFGRFKTDIGVLNTDIGFKIDKDNKLIYSGLLNTEAFNIGHLTGSAKNLNKVTMDVAVQGYRTTDYHFNTFIKGTIDSIDFNNYKYEKVVLNGLLSNNKFNGQVTLNDPNAKLFFNGKIDFNNEIPQADFEASLHNVKLDKLNLAPKLINSEVNLSLVSQLKGNSIDNITGNLLLYDGHLTTEDKEVRLDTLLISSLLEDEIKTLKIESDILDAQIKGSYKLASFGNEIKNEIGKYLPALVESSEKPINNSGNYSFDIRTKNLSSLIEIISPDIEISDGSGINGFFNGDQHNFELHGQFGKVRYKSIHGDNVDLDIKTNENKLASNFNSELLSLGNIIPLHNFKIMQQAAGDSMLLYSNWDNFEEHRNSGALYTKTKFKKSHDNKLFTLVELFPSEVIINDSTWNIQESNINITPYGFRINTFRVWHINQEININGSLFKTSSGKLISHFQNIDLSEVTQLFSIRRLNFDGILNGRIEVKENFSSPIITSNLLLDDLRINDEDVGDLFIESSWDKTQKAVIVDTEIKKQDITPLIGSGYFKPSNKDYNFNFELDSLPIGFLNLYLSKIMQNLKGTATGKLDLRKTKYGVGLDGGLTVNKAKFDVGLLKCSFFLEDSVSFTPTSIVFNNMTVTDPNGKKGKFNGSIYHRNFYNMSYDLYLRANNMLLLNSQEKDNPLYYGTVYGTGDLAITGTTYDLLIDINAKTEKNTRFFIPMSDRQESLNSNFIQFINTSDTLSKDITTIEEEYQIDLSNFALSMGIEITPDAQVQVIFDPALGDILKSSGKGNLQVNMDKEGDVTFFGDYVAEEGDYLFSLENVVNKRFDITEGGTVIWEGDPYNAIIDLTATYKLKTSLQPLMMTSSSEGSDSPESARRVPIHCDMILGDRLSQPTIQFDISAPTMEQSTQNLIEDAISTEEELNRQVLSLLVLNKFYTPDYNANNSGATRVNSAAIANTSEVISSQLSNWLSQISNDFDIGISYRPEDEISSEQIEVALSTQIFNDRVTLNGNVEYGKFSQTQQNSSNIVGDFDMDVKLNKSGSLRAKAYTHSNDDFSFDNSPTTEGVGISYHEEFNTFGELFRKYWNWITGKGKKEKRVKEEEDKNNNNDK